MNRVRPRAVFDTDSGAGGRREASRLPRRLFSLLCLAVMGSILVLSGCGGGGNEKAAEQRPGDGEDPRTNSASPATAQATTQTTSPIPAPSTSPEPVRGGLDTLRVSPEGSMSGYSREEFPHWSRANDFGWDAPEDSCDAREAALIRDGEDVEVGEGCKVSSGSWYDPYTTNTYTDPQEIDIDHVVPLANAWRSGASGWNDEQRERYANDPDVLLSVEDNANQEKGDKGPEAWKPPNEGEWCDYAVRWISIKGKYDLTVNQDEKAALEEMLGTCA